MLADDTEEQTALSQLRSELVLSSKQQEQVRDNWALIQICPLFNRSGDIYWFVPPKIWKPLSGPLILSNHRFMEKSISPPVAVAIQRVYNTFIDPDLVPHPYDCYKLEKASYALRSSTRYWFLTGLAF